MAFLSRRGRLVAQASGSTGNVVRAFAGELTNDGDAGKGSEGWPREVSANGNDGRDVVLTNEKNGKWDTVDQ
uniref:Uncharacterized protein n=1 Tax=Peronospora matthiolae TaxID=2874970 RepID=A0AAV1UYG8_9STRA